MITTIDIDPEAIYRYANDNGMSLEEISHSIGRTSKYLYNVCRNGKMSWNVYNFLLTVYGLPAKSFLPKKKKVTPPHIRRQSFPLHTVLGCTA